MLSCIYRLNQGFGINHIIEVLRGAKTAAAVLNRDHEKLSTWGIGQDKSHEHWLSVTRQLIHLGYASQDITRGSSVKLNSVARSVLKGDVALMLAVPRIKLSIHKQRINSKKPSMNYDRALFAKLKALRRNIANEQEVPPYLVFTDATLAEMAATMPTFHAEMLAVNGVGERKLSRFGDEFLDLIESYIANN